MKLRNEYTCPLELTHDMMRGKWKSIILWRLRLGPTSLSHLQQDITGITQKMLLEQLRELMEFGLVEKEISSGYPLHVAYFLTEIRGKRMLDALKIMQEVGIDFMLKNGMEQVLQEKGVLPKPPQ